MTEKKIPSLTHARTGKLALGIMWATSAALILIAAAAMVNIELVFVALPLWLNTLVAVSLLAVGLTCLYLLSTRNSHAQWASQSKNPSTLGMLTKGILSSLPASLVIGGIFALLVFQNVLMLTPLTALLACAVVFVAQVTYTMGVHYWRKSYSHSSGASANASESATARASASAPAPAAAPAPARVSIQPVASTKGWDVDLVKLGSVKRIIDYLAQGVVTNGLLPKEAAKTAVGMVYAMTLHMTAIRASDEVAPEELMRSAIVEIETVLQISKQARHDASAQFAKAQEGGLSLVPIVTHDQMAKNASFVTTFVNALLLIIAANRDKLDQLAGSLGVAGIATSDTPVEDCTSQNLALDMVVESVKKLRSFAESLFARSQVIYSTDSSLSVRLNCVLAAGGLAGVAYEFACRLQQFGDDSDAAGVQLIKQQILAVISNVAEIVGFALADAESLQAQSLEVKLMLVSIGIVKEKHKLIQLLALNREVTERDAQAIGKEVDAEINAVRTAVAPPAADFAAPPAVSSS